MSQSIFIKAEKNGLHEMHLMIISKYQLIYSGLNVFFMVSDLKKTVLVSAESVLQIVD